MIVELQPGDARIGSAFEIVRQLRPHIAGARDLFERFERQHGQGYRLAAVFDISKPLR